jgi:hypothetical protein
VSVESIVRSACTSQIQLIIKSFIPSWLLLAAVVIKVDRDRSASDRVQLLVLILTSEVFRSNEAPGGAKAVVRHSLAAGSNHRA